ERAEKILQTSGLSWNVVRASWFFQNFSEGFMVEGILEGELLLPVGDTVEPFIDADDIADVAVAALTKTELRNRLFEVTGPEALTFSQCTEIMSKALGRTVRYQQVPLEAFLGALKKQGLPEDVLWLMNELFTVVLDGRNSKVMNGVEEALGRSATKFETYVARTAASGVWNSPETAALS
ncbi:MAG: NmrA family NAD(P)-binding protein, partial [Candidatus Eisenbacteria bacterium]|nr:NmrA family NAD(P)-binding protein [Candidatus Eisenbacteria bacterium]